MIEHTIISILGLSSGDTHTYIGWCKIEPIKNSYLSRWNLGQCSWWQRYGLDWKRHCNRWYIKGLRHPSGKGERLIIFGAEGEMCVGFSTLPSSSILRKHRRVTWWNDRGALWGVVQRWTTSKSSHRLIVMDNASF